MPFSFTKILKIKNDNNVKDIHHKLLEGLTKSSTDQIFIMKFKWIIMVGNVLVNIVLKMQFIDDQERSHNLLMTKNDHILSEVHAVFQHFL